MDEQEWWKFVTTTVAFTILIVAMAFVMTGCTHRVEDFKCKCSCDDNTLECSARELKTKLNK